MMASLARLLQLARPVAGWIALAAALGFATVASAIGLMAAGAYIISGAALQPSIAELQVAIVMVRFFGLARAVFRYLERLVTHEVTFRLLARLRVWFFSALEPLVPARTRQLSSGDLLARVVGDVEALEHLYARALAPPLVAVAVGAATAALLAAYDPALAAPYLLIFTAAGLGIPALTLVLGSRVGPSLTADRASLTATATDSAQGLPDLLAFGAERAQLDRARDLDSRLARGQGRMAAVTGLHQALGGLLAQLAVIAVLLTAIPLVHQGRLDGVSLAVIALATLASFEAATPLPAAAQLLRSQLISAKRVFEIIDAQPAVIEPASPLPARGIRLDRGLTLDVDRVTFTYPSASAPALEGLSLSLPAERRVAVVGPSGAGKSTLLHILQRSWDPDSGTVALGGADLRRYRLEDLRRLIGVLPQSTWLLGGTIRDNLLLGRPGASEAELRSAVAAAQLEDEVDELPEGLDTWIGEQGVRLSGGQRQRLAIARTLLRDPPLLLLDEPTTHLDPTTAGRLWTALETAMAGRTTLVITHRLTGLETMDEILVLERGRVVERGRHHDLLSLDSLYRRLWDAQHSALP